MGPTRTVEARYPAATHASRWQAFQRNSGFPPGIGRTRGLRAVLAQHHAQHLVDDVGRIGTVPGDGVMRSASGMNTELP